MLTCTVMLLSKILIGYLTLSQEYCKLIGQSLITMRGQLYTPTCLISPLFLLLQFAREHKKLNSGHSKASEDGAQSGEQISERFRYNEHGKVL